MFCIGIFELISGCGRGTWPGPGSTNCHLSVGNKKSQRQRKKYEKILGPGQSQAESFVRPWLPKKRREKKNQIHTFARHNCGASWQGSATQLSLQGHTQLPRQRLSQGLSGCCYCCCCRHGCWKILIHLKNETKRKRSTRPGELARRGIYEFRPCARVHVAYTRCLLIVSDV